MQQGSSYQEEEEAFVKRFIIQNKRERYLSYLANPKKRHTFLNVLYHCGDIVWSLATEIFPRDSSADQIEQFLKQRGAGETCYVISVHQELDRQVIPLNEVLNALHYDFEVAIVCCLTGRLAYYKAEDGEYILEYKPQAKE